MENPLLNIEAIIKNAENLSYHVSSKHAIL